MRMLPGPAYGDAIAVEIESVEHASRQLLEALGAGGFRARVERQMEEGTPNTLVGRSRTLRVDGTMVWRGRWVAFGSTVRWEADWFVEVHRLVTRGE